MYSHLHAGIGLLPGGNEAMQAVVTDLSGKSDCMDSRLLNAHAGNATESRFRFGARVFWSATEQRVPQSCAPMVACGWFEFKSDWRQAIHQ